MTKKTVFVLLAALLVMALPVHAGIDNDAIIAYYGGDNLTDMTGNIDLTSSGAVYETGLISNAYNLSTDGSHLVMSSTASGVVSTCYWANHQTTIDETSSWASDYTFLAHQTTGTLVHTVVYGANQGWMANEVWSFIYDYTGQDSWYENQNDFPSNEISGGVYHHYCMVCDGSNNMDMYFDGALLGTGSTTQGTTVCPNDIRWNIGRWVGEATTYTWAGTIDEIMFSNQTLSATEVKQIYDNNTLGYKYPVWHNGTTPSDPFVYVKVNDKYDSANIEGLNVTLSNGRTNLTDATGVAYFLNQSGNIDFNITDPQNRYFDYYSTTNATENTTTSVYAVGSFVTLESYDIDGNQLSNFTACSGTVCNSSTGSSLKLVLKPNTTNNVEFSPHQFINQSTNFSIDGQDTGTYNITGLYQGIIIVNANDTNGAPVNTFTINISGDHTRTVSTTNGTVAFNLLWGNYTLEFYNENSTVENTTIELTNISTSYVFTAYTKNSFNFTFYNEETLAVVSDRTIYIELIGDLYSGNFTTDNGTWYADLLTPQVYTVRYDAENYTERFYVFNLTDKSRNDLSLYLLPDTSSSEVTVTVYDTLGNFLEGAYVKILRYDVTTNTFIIVDIVQTNFQGEAIADLALNDEYYKFIIEYSGDVVLTTNPTYVFGTTLNFYVPIDNTGLETYFEKGAISGLISYDSTTQLASFTWSDSDNTASQGCLYGYKPLNGGLTQLNSSCASASSGTVYMPLSNTTSTTWFLVGKVSKDSTTHDIDSLRVDFDSVMPENGLGPFIAALLVIVVVFIGFWSLPVAVLLASIIPLLFTITKLAAISYAISIPIFIGGIIVAVILGVRR